MTKKEIRQYIVDALRDGRSRVQCADDLKKIAGPEYTYTDFNVWVREYPDPILRESYRPANWILVILLLLVFLFHATNYVLNLFQLPAHFGLWVIWEPVFLIMVPLAAFQIVQFTRSAYRIVIMPLAIYLPASLQGLLGRDTGILIGDVINVALLVFALVLSLLLRRMIFPPAAQTPS